MTETRSIGATLFNAAVVVGAAVAFVASGNLPDIGGQGSLPPSFFPRVTTAAIALLASICLIRDVAAMYRAQQRPCFPSITLVGVAGLAIFAVMMGYALLFERLGYILSTALFVVTSVAVLSLLARRSGQEKGAWSLRRGVGLVVLALAFAITIFYLFLVGFSITLPGLPLAD
ncbi:tripartite tricarboxylate transporter TctB family protein [Vreelandella olivaria]|uniref:tripartite tricarboxylate transporter TctB family protein n=1 Tax=Vreelandella olivaria TaxID=390919 RepID=UPI00201E8E28|nr:tripartite tricarboxylate transporter TctB family protein [Halomonas olivaria]